MFDANKRPTQEAHLGTREGRGRHARQAALRFLAVACVGMFSAACAVAAPSAAKHQAALLPHYSPITGPTTTMAPPTTVTANASSQLNSYVSAEAASDAAAERAVGQPWRGYLYTSPVNDGGTLVAVAAFSYDPTAKPVQVLGYTDGQWGELTVLPIPPGEPGTANIPAGAAMSPYWLAEFSGAAISVADVTGDGRPDFLVPINAADNVPGAVISQDGTQGGAWRYIPFEDQGSSTKFYELGRSPEFRGNVLVSTYDNCQPNCAQGATTTVTWSYEGSLGVFSAPSPP